MNNMNKLCLCIATLVSFSCLGMMRQVIRDENGFRVFDGQQEHTVQPYFVDSLLKRMNPEQMQKFVERGNRIRAIRLSDGEYRLQAMVPVNGGGILAAQQAYWATKVGLYAILGLAVGGTIAATGGAVVAAGSAVAAGTATVGTVATGVGAGIASTAVGTAACGSAASGLAVGVATTTAAVEGGAEVAAATAAVTTGVSAMATVSSAGAAGAATVGGAAGICASVAAGIEAAAVSAFMAALVCPWTPW
jgi:hypothetical protein